MAQLVGASSYQPNCWEVSPWSEHISGLQVWFESGHLCKQPINVSLSFFLIFLNLIFIIFFPLPFSPLMSPSPISHHIIVLVRLISFLLNASTHWTPHPTSCQLLLIYESVSVLLVSSICSLDSMYEWNHMVFVFLWLAYFTQHNVPQVKG